VLLIVNAINRARKTGLMISEVIEHAVWLYHCYSLHLRDVELILAARGIVVSYESIREWACASARSSPIC
jgi:transposase-like protein